MSERLSVKKQYELAQSNTYWVKIAIIDNDYHHLHAHYQRGFDFLHWTRRLGAQEQVTHLKAIGDSKLDEG